MNTNRQISWPALLAGGLTAVALSLDLQLCTTPHAQRTATALNGFVPAA